jgi:RIO-like serine/threonine protein kinase
MKKERYTTMLKIENKKGTEICEKLDTEYRDKMTVHYVHSDESSFWGYVDEFGLLFVPFGSWVEIYEPGEYI